MFRFRPNFSELSHNLFFILLITFPTIASLSLFPSYLKSKPSVQQSKSIQSQEIQGLNSYSNTPRIYISGGNYSYSSGGLISLASTDEPAVTIDGYKITSDAKIDVYRANETAVLNYLLHNDKSEQIKKEPDTSSFTYITSISTGVDTQEGTKVTLPLENSGIWYLKVQVGDTTAHAYVVRSDTGIVTKEGDNELIFWGQNYKTRRSVSDGTITLYNLENNTNVLSTVSFNAEGIAKSPVSDKDDIALIKRGDDIAIVPLNLKYLNTGRNSGNFDSKKKLTRYFIFTDRPLYQPGDTVYFKGILRNDDDARYSLPSGNVTVTISQNYDGRDPLFQKSISISSDGSIDGEYKLPDGDAGTGYYYVSMTLPGQENNNSYYYGWGGTETNSSEYADNGSSFSVEYFRKPEFSLDIEVEKTKYIAGDEGKFTISGSYFSGQPLIGQDVRYTVYATSFYEYDYFSDLQYQESSFDEFRYWWYSYNGKVIKSGTATLDNTGKVVVIFDTHNNSTDELRGKHQIYNISATLADDSQNPSSAERNVLVSSGEYSIFRKDTSYYSKAGEQFSLPLVLVANKSDAKLSGVTLTAKIKNEWWTSYQEENKKHLSYKKEEEVYPDITGQTNSQGEIQIKFTPKRTGSYTITIEGKDSRGNDISKTFYTYASSENEVYHYSQYDSGITIVADKKQYESNATARLEISSDVPDRDVLLTLERGRIDRFQIVRMNGKKATVTIPIIPSDIPNIYADVASFSTDRIESAETQLIINPQNKKLNVDITTDDTHYGPGETVQVTIATTDNGGNPESAEVTLWAIDKAIFELSDTKLGNIFKTFWNPRINSTESAHSLEGILVYNAEGGGCFAKGTKILMTDGSLKNIEDIAPGEFIKTRNTNNSDFVSAKVLSIHKAEEPGYLILNGTLKITANHIIRVNNEWKQAGDVQVGDWLTNQDGTPTYISSIEWQLGKTESFNLEIENEHTYIAEGYWVHNQKGDTRDTFKDTAYWNPSIRTDSSGRAKVSFKLPDNLTTWALTAVAQTPDTKVGQTTAEIIVTKDVIVRPIVPNILRIGDKPVVSALVQNFTEKDLEMTTDLAFDAGQVKGASDSDFTLKSKETKHVYWELSPETEKDNAKLRFVATSKTDKDQSDAIELTLPIREYGFEERHAKVGNGNKTFSLSLNDDTNKDKSSIILSASSTILGSLPSAMKYLVEYPYGCVEQTTSRFVPAVIAKMNQSLFADALKDKDLNDIIKTGIDRLKSHQHSDGGWTWWYTGNSDPFVSVYVLEYLLEAKKAGANVDESILMSAKSYFEHNYRWESASGPDNAIRQYGLALLNSDKKQKVTSYENFSSDVLAITVMANYLQGDRNANTNGLSLLENRAVKETDAAYWSEGFPERFPSKDASTALAIRAIILAGGNRDLAVQGSRYLMRSRQYDYWSNTFATAQVIRALTDLSKTGSELSPQYRYTISLDGKQITSGTVSGKLMRDITIPMKEVRKDSKVTVAKEGEGQLYTTLVEKEWRTDKEADATDHGLSITREYVSSKGEEYSLAVGDSVTVNLTVDGNIGDRSYAVIHDELPAGLIPINESFKNERYGETPKYQYGVSDREVTQNGMILSLYRIAAGEQTYTYRARVVSSGTFSAPPAYAELMYSPEVYGRTKAETIQIDSEAKIIPGKAAKKTIEELGKNKLSTVFAMILVFILATLVVVNKNRPDFFAKIKQFTNIKEKIRSRYGKSRGTDENNPPPPTDIMTG